MKEDVDNRRDRNSEMEKGEEDKIDDEEEEKEKHLFKAIREIQSIGHEA